MGKFKPSLVLKVCSYLALTKNLRGVGQGLEQTYLYLWYSLFQWNKYNVRAVTIFDQRQYTIIYSIDQRQYTIVYNIRSVTIYNQWQNKIICNIQYEGK